AAGTIGAVRSAATLPPAQAMRPEAPPDYRATLSERIGLRHLFGPAGRMVVRHLERRPLRAVLSTLGMSLAVAVLIVGSFMTGAIHYLVDFMFFTTQRQDMTVALVEPGTPGTMHAIAQLPGVISAEPFRAVPARLRAGGRSRLQGVMGLPAQPRLNRVVDADEHPVAMPPDGLLLSDGLARALDVGAGDRVIVEVLDGRRPTVELTVTGIAQTYAGTAAYMDIVALNRLMREGPVVSGAALDVDPRLAAALYHTLKQTPAVASVTLKRAALDSFNETLAENLLRMRLFNVVFAVIIAFGVVYNSARISLAERAHELATMRVLGFTRAEVSSVLLGELAVLTILAIPVGMVLGSGLARLVTTLMSGENISMPFIISPGTYAFAGIVIILAALVSGLVVRRGVDHLDLVEVLKTKG
ncbi:MAG: FtsX-like permease family protein, partial [Phycisphaerales bacterium]|nr:FtsX-like permease family protein [Phycisphaerales bacterium]